MAQQAIAGQRPDVSVVIPVCNEGKSIRPLYDDIRNVLDQLGKAYEFLFVDDGSTDGTFEEIKAIASWDERVHGISILRNSGKAAALAIGIERARGTHVLTMDGDLQEDPKDIPLFFDKIQQGFDMVVGWKYKRKDPMTKTVPSFLFNLLLRTINGLDIHDCDCNFRLMKRDVINQLQLYGGLYRFIPVMAKNAGFRIGEVRIRHHPRRHGKSKYGASRLVGGFFDFLTVAFLQNYLKRPMHFFGLVGASLFAVGSIIGIHLAYIRLLRHLLFGGVPTYIGGRPLLLLAILLVILGFQFISIGLIGEMLVSFHAPRHKDYIIKKEF